LVQQPAVEGLEEQGLVAGVQAGADEETELVQQLGEEPRPGSVHADHDGRGMV
jgi:hypothetical protein